MCSISEENAPLTDQRDEVKEIRKLSSGDTRRIRLWRFVVTGVLLVTALVVTLITYKALKDEEYGDFVAGFEKFVESLSISVSRHNDDLLEGFQAFSEAYTSYAVSSNSTWPFVTIPFFETLGKNFLKQTKIEVMVPYHFVRHEEREVWKTYSAMHYESYIEEGLQISPEYRVNFTPENYNADITSWDMEGNFFPSPDAERYAVIWGNTPPAADYGVLNLDSFTDDSIIPMVNAVEQLKTPLYTALRIVSPSWAEQHANVHSALNDPTLSHPHSFMQYPIFKELNNFDSEIVGLVSTLIAWDVPMRKLLPSGVNGVVCVIRNSCGDVFTYEIDGPEAYFLGESDKHETKYDSMAVHLDLVVEEIGKSTHVPGHCVYNMTVYPSSRFQESYDSNTPEAFAGIVACTFVVVAVVFFIYDIFVQHRNEKLVVNAARSNAIVSSLFPSNFRDRIIGASAQETSLSIPRNLKSFMASSGTDTDGTKFESKPLADIFLESTVMFADISGFTAWSSSREPSQVFTLLEAVFGEFDRIAKLRRVFKVETVGDCFVAATGIPDVRSDHAVVMLRYARAILMRMNVLTKKLEIMLGPDTGDLSLRIGIHSGPVTAGVLRGERARFQLFGDTMNTTSRIESTGEPGKVHVSQATAELIIKAGKGKWLTKRDDKIIAKGKGEMQTYWCPAVIPKDREADESSKYDDEEISVGLEDVAEDERKMRLVDWVVEQLSDLLKQIVACRQAVSGQTTETNRVSVDSPSPIVEKGGYLLDQVKEIIPLPEFDSKANSYQKQASQVTIEPEVLRQLKEYTACVANMYHDNDFHNFEHASHVTMSVLKLMSRIVAPSDLDLDVSTDDFYPDESNNKLAATLHDHTYGITSDPLTQFACAFSALIHDADHPGVPNSQLVKEETTVAMVYGNRSVAEQNSLVISWDLLMQDQFRELRTTLCSTQAELMHFRELIVNCVLATDIVDQDLKALRNARWDKAFKQEKQSESASGEPDAPRDKVNRRATIVIEHLIQASDVAHTMQHWHVYRKWNERFFNECYAAYKAGRADKDPSIGWYRGELGFFDFYIIPLAKKLKDCGVFGKSSDEYLNYAIQNRREWEERGQEIVASMVESLFIEI